jgi:hypothetical protein
MPPTFPGWDRRAEAAAEMEWARNIYWMYAIVVERTSDSVAMIAGKLDEAGIEPHVLLPMNQQPCLQSREGYRCTPLRCGSLTGDRTLLYPSSWVPGETIRRSPTASSRRAQPWEVANDLSKTETTSLGMWAPLSAPSAAW